MTSSTGMRVDILETFSYFLADVEVILNILERGFFRLRFGVCVRGLGSQPEPRNLLGAWTDDRPQARRS